MFSKKFFVTLAVLSLIGIMTYGMIGSGAWFSDAADSGETSVNTATLSINNTALESGSIVVPNLAPGDVTPEITFYITNNGNTNLAWFGDLVIDSVDGLSEVIYIDYAKMEFLGGGWDEPDDTFIENGVGAGEYPTAYNAIAAMSPYGKITLNNFDGTSAMGVSPFEFMGALRPGYAYKLTLRLGMVGDADNSYQAKGPLTLSMHIDARQVNVEALNSFHTDWGTYHYSWLSTQISNQD